MASDLFVIGLSWRTAPVELREKLAFADPELEAALDRLRGSPNIGEALLLSTCNRVEVYAAAPRGALEAATSEVRHFLAAARGVPGEMLAEVLYERVDVEAVRHVFRVASSLDSMVVGESQILGQLKDAYGAAVHAGAAGPLITRCMERAFGVAKRVRSETGIAAGAANVSSVAVELARRVFGELAGKTILLVGAGKMSALAARHLRADGAAAILVTNRSPARAAELAAQVEGQARPWEDLGHHLAAADVVITSTGSPEPVLTRGLLKPAMKARKYRPLVIIDIAVPRDADPDIAKLDGVYLFDIDDLEKVVAENLKARATEAESAARIVETEVGEFGRWLRSQVVVPTIRALRDRFTEVARAEAEKSIKGLRADSAPAERDQAIRRLADAIVNKLLHTPLTALKSGQDEGEVERLVAAANRLFELAGEEAAEAPPPPADPLVASKGSQAQ